MQTSFNSHVIAPQGPIYQERFILALLLFTLCRTAETSRSNSVMMGSQITHGLSLVTATLQLIRRAGRSCSHIHYNRQFTEGYLSRCQLAVLSLSRSGHTGTHTHTNTEINLILAHFTASYWLSNIKREEVKHIKVFQMHNQCNKTSAKARKKK